MQMSFKSDILYNLKKLKSATVKVLAREMDVATGEKREFQAALQTLIKEKKVDLGPGELLTLTKLAVEDRIGTFKRLQSGHGIVTMAAKDGRESVEWFIKGEDVLQAITGDRVQIAPAKSNRPYEGASDRAIVVEVIEHAKKTFVGTFTTKNDKKLVRIDDDLFDKSFLVTETLPEVEVKDRVWVEVIEFPELDKRGTCKILERLGEAGDISTEERALLRNLGISEVFPPEVLADAKRIADEFEEVLRPGREDFTEDLVITIDPKDAKDHDDAVTLTIDPKTKHRILTVHIADVSYFITPGGPLDIEARKRGTSVYLPMRAIPMFPELVSNHVASLKEGVLRYVKTVRIEYNAQGARVSTTFTNGAIRVRQRFNYDEIQQFIDGSSVEWPTETQRMIREMHAFSQLLRKRRFARGSLEMHLPEIKLDYNREGEITGAFFAKHSESHQLIEEFMLAANEAVAGHFREMEVPFLRRIHPSPLPQKLETFAEFARSLGFKIQRVTDRFELQRVLDESAKTEHRHAVHFAMLRSLKQAIYSPSEEGHFALASEDYCHFTSPIRRYPDLTVHRLLNQWIKKKKVSYQEDELKLLGEQCSKRERLAEEAERGAVELRMKEYVRGNVGREFDATITGVIEKGFFAQGNSIPVEGFVSLDDFPGTRFDYNATLHSLQGRQSRLAFRLGQEVRVKIVGIDPERQKTRLKVVK